MTSDLPLGLACRPDFVSEDEEREPTEQVGRLAFEEIWMRGQVAAVPRARS